MSAPENLVDGLLALAHEEVLQPLLQALQARLDELEDRLLQVVEGATPARGDKATATRLLTTQEVADLFHVDPRTVRRHSRSGQLPEPLHVGGSVRYRSTDILPLLHAQGQPEDGGQS